MEYPLFHPAISDRIVFKVGIEVHTSLYSGGIRSTDSEAMNKTGKLLRDEPILGRVMASKKHIYVDGLNVRKIVEDLGHLILYNVRKSIFPIYEICESVERSN